MKFFLQLLVSFILPVTVLLVIPWCIEPEISIKSLPSFFAGLLLIITGQLVISLQIILFARKGKGTLAPWSPPKQLVVSGFYCYMRNPMICGVLIVLLGEALAILSLNILLWAIAFFLLNNIWFVLYEEPHLDRQFGDEYRHYKKHVRRWIPRLKPYTAPENA